MNKVILTPNKAVNIEKTLKIGFFSVTASLCGLLTGSTGCSAPSPVSTLTFATGAKMLKDHLQKQSAGDEYPRLIEPQFLARLDGNRQAVPMHDPNDLAGGVIPTNAVPQADLWDTALYYAVKETSQDFSFLPPVRDIIGSDFGALTYEVDDTTGTTIIKPTAYETEPYTGRVILENNATQILVAYINRGRFAETGTLWNDTGELVLAENHYDELGYPARAKEWDEDGQLIAQRPQVDPTQPTLPPGVQPLPIGAILVADSEVRGEFIYQRADDALLEKLNQQIEAATDPDESTRLQGELLQAQLAAATPFNGTVLEFWDKDRTKKKREEPVVIGKHEGTVIWWYENGQKEFEAEYLKGIPQGRTAWYREDGSLEYEGFWQDDNGTPKLQRASTWDATDAQSGQVIDGNGTLVYFHSNGQKRMEETFTNGLLTASSFWDEMGEPVESVDPSFIPPPPKLD
jgi:antitoxin component YwqK of YwqJK toxin-antitoxin module